MKSSSRILGIIVLILGFIALSMGMKAQRVVVRQGNTFIEQRDSTSRGGATKTDFIYTDANGVSDTIYISRNGNAFVWKVSKRTGKTYRKYLPKVSEQIGTKKR